MTGKDSNYIARVSLPFFMMMVVAIAIITIWPVVVTWLPDIVMQQELTSLYEHRPDAKVN
jgi:TRAP-type C4-dicarboxylate transport system permease large subunit